MLISSNLVVQSPVALVDDLDHFVLSVCITEYQPAPGWTKRVDTAVGDDLVDGRLCRLLDNLFEEGLEGIVFSRGERKVGGK